MWHLPGPQSLVDDIVRSVNRGQHVSAVLPRYLNDNDEVRGDLCRAVVTKVDGAGMVNLLDTERSLIEELGHQMTADDYPPTAIPDLLRHPDVAGRTWVLDGSELGATQRQQLPAFLQRIALDSRSVGGSERMTLVAVISAASLPTFAGHDHSDVTHASCWHWNRMARWDVAAHVAALSTHSRRESVLGEVRAEVIVELARWDLAFATVLAEEWDGTLSSFHSLASSRYKPIEPSALDVASRFRDRPPETLLAHWDDGAVDVWHDALATAPGTAAAESDLNRCLWAAQARVLLPWIELKRTVLEKAAERALGRSAFRAAIRACADDRDGDGVLVAGAIAEIGLLEKVIRYELRRAHPELARAAAALRRARNDLAHLTPIELTAVEELVEKLRLVT